MWGKARCVRDGSGRAGLYPQGLRFALRERDFSVSRFLIWPNYCPTLLAAPISMTCADAFVRRTRSQVADQPMEIPDTADLENDATTPRPMPRGPSQPPSHLSWFHTINETEGDCLAIHFTERGGSGARSRGIRCLRHDTTAIPT